MVFGYLTSVMIFKYLLGIIYTHQNHLHNYVIESNRIRIMKYVLIMHLPMAATSNMKVESKIAVTVK